MKKLNYLILLGVTAAAGTAAGILSNRDNPKQGGLIGAAAGLLAGSVAVEVYHRMTADDGIGYYTQSSPLYEDFEDIEYR